MGLHEGKDIYDYVITQMLGLTYLCQPLNTILNCDVCTIVHLSLIWYPCVANTTEWSF